MLEDVDRKTAAAAYRRLQKEGLVRVQPRSGVYLESEGVEDDRDPLRRLHLQWLERALATAAELGLSAEALYRMFQSVTVVEKSRIPVVDEDPAYAELVATELRERMGLECVAARPQDLPARVGPLRNPPFVLATPAGASALEALAGRVPVITIRLNSGLFREVCQAAEQEPVVVVVGSESLKEQLQRALVRGLCQRPDHVRILHPRSPGDLEAGPEGARMMVWPGTPDWIHDSLADGAMGTQRLLSDDTLSDIRAQVARTALDHVSTTSAVSM